ncbi:flagellar filament capping protein FliD [Halomonas daqiaonensis]|uniref:Flagellar hook-associated protein 2 n=1 Tax=Halomonas daqiaonensis TaxID=650850 RepID=A0A1H7SMP7_9GAMM|nr:flagellar filament capping protein FliD [Halomonas daqiaonensis]SEL73738.1 flagellar hook-associated protein 2 [Halomonas daqiaonensis]
MASISSLGIGSGLDLNGLLDQLRSAEREKLAPLATQKSQEQSKISAFGRLQSGLDKFQDAVAKLNDTSLYEGLSAKVQGDGMSATASAEANPGRYEVSVTQTARAGSLASTQVTNLDDPLAGANATLDLTFGDGGTKSIALAEGATLGDIRDTINADPDARVDASIINDGTGNRLVLSSRESGADAGITGMTFTNLAGGLTEDAATAQPGRNAELNINGIAITSPTNTVEGAIQGVTLQLDPSATGETLNLDVSRDTGALKEAVGKLVSSYNELQSTIGRLTAYGGGEGSSGELIGDRTVRNIESDLARDLTSSVAGGELSIMSQLGVSLNDKGRLELDDAKLNEIIADDPQQLSDFFAGADEAGGLAGRMEATLGRFLDDGGRIDSAIGSSESRVESLDRRYARMEQSVERTIERYRTQFSQLDSMIANMNQTSSYLTQQFASLDAQLGRD